MNKKRAADQELLQRVRTRLRRFGLRIHKSRDPEQSNCYNVLDNQGTIEECGTLHQIARKWGVPRTTKRNKFRAAITTAFERFKAEKERDQAAISTSS